MRPGRRSHWRLAFALAALIRTLGVTAAASAASAPEPVLRGLVFVPGIAAFDPHGVPLAAGPVDVSRVRILNQPDFANKMRSLVGQPLTLATLNQIPPLASAVFEASGRPAVHVTIPEQDVTAGIVQVVIVEYTVGQVVVEGAAHFGPDLYRAAIGTRHGEVIDLPVIQTGLRQINASEYRSAEAVLRPGTEAGTVDVVVRAQDRRPATVSAGYNNSGPVSTGRGQWTLGFALANTLGNLDDVIAYQLQSSDFVRRASAALTNSLSYSLAIPTIGQVALQASYSRTRPPVDSFLSSHGESIQVSPRFVREIFGDADRQISVRGGYDFKSTNNDLLFGGVTVTHGLADISQFELSGLLARADGRGRTDGSLSLVVSPGRMMAANDDTSFRGLAQNARAQYVYLRLDATRSTTLPGMLSLWSHVAGQVASNGLLPSEQLNAGGMASVRGYPTSTVRGDSGLMLSNELRFSAGGLGGLVGVDLRDRLQPFVFIDYAAVSARRSGGQGAVDGTLTSFGAGMRIDLDRYVTLGVDIGGQIRVGGGRRYPGQFFDISVSVKY